MSAKNLKYYESKHDLQFSTNTALIMVIGYKINKEPGPGYDFMLSLDTDIRDYHLINFFEANMAFRSGHNEEALAILNGFDLSKVELRFDHYNYMMGNILLRKLDPNAAVYFNKFLASTEFRSYKKETTYKLAESFMVQGDLDEFRLYKELAEDTDGDELVERDREATYDSELDYDPNPNLLKARLLISGGYLPSGFQELQKFNRVGSTFLPYLTDYQLLLGEYYFKTTNYSLATQHLKQAIEMSEDEDYQLASAAAVLLGKVYDSMSSSESQRYYELAIALYEDEYYESIESFAKSRLSQMTVGQ